MDRSEEVDLRYLRICREYAQLTRCLSRRVGALLLSPDNIVIGLGVNGPPSGTSHCEGEVCPRKLSGDTSLDSCPAVHAEVNAIMSCGRTNNSTNDGTLYIYPIGPCKGCASQIIQAGIRKIIFPESTWYDDLAPKLLGEAGIEIVIYPLSDLDRFPSCTG